MLAIVEHFRNEEGTCNCPITGNCFKCQTPCTDHDLVADYYWCNTCINKTLDNYPIV